MATNCSKCKCGTPCGCNSGGPLTTPSACPPNPCCETFDSQCVIYTGPPILCNDEVIVPTNTPISTIINTLVGLSCQVINTTTYDCVNGQCVEIQGTSGEYTTLQECQDNCTLAPTCKNPIEYILEQAYITYKDPDNDYDNVWDALFDLLKAGTVINNTCSTYCCPDCGFECGDKFYYLGSVQPFGIIQNTIGIDCNNLAKVCCPNTGFNTCLDELIAAGLDLPDINEVGLFEYGTLLQKSQLCAISNFIGTLVPADYGDYDLTEALTTLFNSSLVVYCKASNGQIVIGDATSVSQYVQITFDPQDLCPEKPPLIECCYNFQGSVSALNNLWLLLGCIDPPIPV